MVKGLESVASIAMIVVASAGAAVGPVAVAAEPHPAPAYAFHRVATYPVYNNVPVDQDPAAPTAAEISAVSQDGRTLVYTDGDAGRLGVLDITRPDHPRGLGTVGLARPGDAVTEPTSVAVVGPYALVAVNTSASYTEPSGRLDIIALSTRYRVRAIDLAGQPDSITVSPDRRYAAIAIENERDSEAAPSGADVGDLPQQPGGMLQIVDLPTADPTGWQVRTVALTAPGGDALALFAAAGVAAPADPEPELVSINAANKIALTLQENNAVAIIDAGTGSIDRVFSTGEATIAGVDTADDGTIDQTGSVTRVREPDGADWIDDRYLATANEGDWRGGTRGWSIFDSHTGELCWDAANTLERLAIRHGLHSELTAVDVGVEPESVAVATFGGTRYAFVGSESSNFVAVYELSMPTEPVFRQLLPVTAAPEGLLTIESRGLLVVSSEEDDAAAGVRSTIALFSRRTGGPTFPALVSASGDDGAPIGWGGLSGLSAAPGQERALHAVTGEAYAPTRLLTIDAARTPAVIADELTVKDSAGRPVGLAATDVSARRAGGYWLVGAADPVAGAEPVGAASQLVRLDAAGVVRQIVSLPDEISAKAGGAALSGVVASAKPAGEQVWVAFQRELSTDPAGLVRLGRYEVTTGLWSWYGYRLRTAGPANTRTELSDLALLDLDTLVVIERDAFGGSDARTKRVYTVDVSGVESRVGAARQTLSPLAKRLAVDLMPLLRAGNGWTEDQVDGLAVGGDGALYVLSDNSSSLGTVDETVLLRIP